MKRNPQDIILILSHTLNNLNFREKYNINNIRDRTKLHWKTAHRYINLIAFIQEYIPEIEIENKSNSNLTFKIKKFCKFLQKYEENEKILIFLFVNQAFDIKSSQKISSENSTLIPKLEEIGLIKNNNSQFYLTETGIKLAYELMNDFLDGIDNKMLKSADKLKEILDKEKHEHLSDILNSAYRKTSQSTLIEIYAS